MPMIRRIQALNYGCLRHIDLSLGQFHVLVGPNASGKSTLFDVVAFLGDMVREGVEVAVRKRTDNFQDLVWGRPSEHPAFELAVEFQIPEDLKMRLPLDKGFGVFRYEVRIGEVGDRVTINAERAVLMPERESEPRQRSLFPLPMPPAESILIGGYRRGARSILSKSSEGKDNFSIEVSPQSGKGWAVSISFGPHRSALGNLPESPEKFPVATRVKRMLETQVTRLFLEGGKMRGSSPPALRREGFSPDGANLPWAIANLKKANPTSFTDWLAHVQTSLPDVETINIVERPDDRHAHLVMTYKSGLQVPSWMASDGTLRFLALTLIPYLEDQGYLYLLEEPENGVHPSALESVYDSLASIYDSQTLVATHSPAFLRLIDPIEALCFAKDDEGATDIVHGVDHPHLRGWQGEAVDTNLLFATGVIG